MTTLALERKDDVVAPLYDDESERDELWRLVERRYRNMLRAVHVLLSDVLELDMEHFRLDDDATNLVLSVAAERVVGIDATTRSSIRAVLREGQARGLSNWEIAYGTSDGSFGGIERLFNVTWRGRAETVVRSELSWAQATSALNRYEASGIVDRVKIYDGDYDQPCASRNGRIVPLAERPMPLHPNCRMVVGPVLREGVAP